MYSPKDMDEEPQEILNSVGSQSQELSEVNEQSPNENEATTSKEVFIPNPLQPDGVEEEK